MPQNLKFKRYNVVKLPKPFALKIEHDDDLKNKNGVPGMLYQVQIEASQFKELLGEKVMSTIHGRMTGNKEINKLELVGGFIDLRDAEVLYFEYIKDPGSRKLFDATGKIHPDSPVK
ncbi:MAG: hypothetical protein NXI20_17755 [bacterium]|nr:hypothetical protein [bacterium]